MRGYIALPAFRGSEFRMYGGPYLKIPQGMVGVKMAAEISAPCEVDIPTRDYCTPGLEAMRDGLYETIEYILEGNPVYAGCMGGIGRTGLILALVAKAWGIEDPVAYVRKNYYSHAVETKEQMEYVANFEINPALKKKIFWGKVKNVLKRKKVLTNYNQ